MIQSNYRDKQKTSSTHSHFIESDNPGSTDSEVRKILTLHIPITEYDTLGSESDNEVSSRALNQSKYRPQRGIIKKILLLSILCCAQHNAFFLFRSSRRDDLLVRDIPNQLNTKSKTFVFIEKVRQIGTRYG